MAIKPLDNILIDLLKGASYGKGAKGHKGGAGKIPGNAPALVEGDVFEAEFVGRKGQVLLLKVQGEILRAVGDLDAGKATRFILRVLHMGPPVQVEVVGASSEAPPEDASPEAILLGLKTRMFASILKGGAKVQGRGEGLLSQLPLFDGEPRPEGFLALSTLKALIAKIQHFKSNLEDKGPLGHLHAALTLDSKAAEVRGSQVSFLPVFFSDNQGMGIVSMSREGVADGGDEGEGDSKGKEGPRARGVSVDLDLFLTRLGQLYIHAFIGRDRLALVLRAQKDVMEQIKAGMQELSHRLAKLGFTVDQVRYIARDGAPRGRGEERGRLHFIL